MDEENLRITIPLSQFRQYEYLALKFKECLDFAQRSIFEHYENENKHLRLDNERLREQLKNRSPEVKER